MSSNIWAWRASVVAGGLIWGWVAAADERTEVWDAPQFWTLAYPLALAACCILGFAWPERPWRWAIVVFVMLLAVMLGQATAAGSSLSILPSGLIVLAVLALPGAAIASFAGWVRRR
jgi:hypothetical protein